MHARTFELPGWPCPPQAHQIPDHPGSYGWVFSSSIFIDTEGHLWVESDAQMRPTTDGHATCLAWTEDGIGLWAPRGVYGSFRAFEDRDESTMTPIARVIPEPPAAEQI